jgi:hypothetical protein
MELNYMSANDRQVGGQHYRTNALQHWDLAAIFEWDYFQARSIAYIMRWRGKGGIKDLEKAGHFIQKYIEVEKAKAVGTLRRDMLLNAIRQLNEEECDEAENQVARAKREFMDAQRMQSAFADFEQRAKGDEPREGPDYQKDDPHLAGECPAAL